MKPPETVTLIDLEGKLVTVIGPNKLDFSEYARIAQIEYRYLDPVYQVYIGRYLIVSEETEDYEEALKLAIFLNDQLTFIRNEMWETLAIYQATLGRYWEVPWYEPSNVFMLEQGVRYHIIDTCNEQQLAYYGVDRGLALAPNGEKVTTYTPAFGTQEDFIEDEYAVGSLKSIKAYKPTVEDFLKNYPDVFSKLPTWKGE